MRPFLYLIAVVAAAGIMIGIVMMPDGDGSDKGTGDIEAEVVAARLTTESGSMTIKVPDMHCAVMCYPKVQKALQAQPNVTGVELDEQKEEGILDNPQVVVHYTAGFDLDAAIAALESNDFNNNERIQ